MDFPPLDRIVEVPVFAASGAFQTTPGYQPASRCYYKPRSGFTLPEVPEIPDPAQRSRARAVLLDALREVSFVDESDRAAAVALMLLPFVMDIVDDITPLHVISSPMQGSGKSTLVDICCWPTVGRKVTPLSEAREEEEWRKRLLAQLLTGSAVTYIDNVNMRMASSALCAVLTSKTFSDRLLGTNQIKTAKNNTVWVLTANNPVLSGEVENRKVPIRLDTGEENPTNKRYDREQVTEWLSQQRSLMIWACAVAVRAWIAAGKPLGTELHPRFSTWSRVIGGILKVVGISGFLADIRSKITTPDPEAQGVRALVASWRTVFGDRWVTAGELLARANTSELELSDKSDRARAISFGKLLGRHRDRRYDDVYIRSTGFEGKQTQWRLESYPQGEERPNV
jgi:hypothetical protein